MNETTTMSPPSTKARLHWTKLESLSLCIFCLGVFGYFVSPLYSQTLDEQSRILPADPHDAVMVDPVSGRPVDQLIPEEQAHLQSVRDLANDPTKKAQ